MKITCISASRIPSDSANSIQVMKVCQAIAQLSHQVVLLVPGIPPHDFDLQAHYGLQTTFPLEWLPERSRHLFPLIAVRRARQLGAEMLYVWPLQSATLGLLAGLPVVLELHDLPSGAFGPLWYWLFLHLPGKKRLLPITEALRGALERLYRNPLRQDQVAIAPNGVDLERYGNLPDPETARSALGLSPGLTVACTGHLYAGRGADLWLDLAAAFPRVNFLWVGGRPTDVDEWRRRASAARLDHVTFTGFVPNARLPLYQAAAEVLLMPYGRAITTSSGGNSSEICSPMKMFEYIAAGRAILTSDLPVLREVLDETCAAFCPPEDSQAWRNALSELLIDPERRQALAQNARNRAMQYAWVERARRTLAGFGV